MFCPSASLLSVLRVCFRLDPRAPVWGNVTRRNGPNVGPEIGTTFVLARCAFDEPSHLVRVSLPQTPLNLWLRRRNFDCTASDRIFQRAEKVPRSLEKTIISMGIPPPSPPVSLCGLVVFSLSCKESYGLRNSPLSQKDSLGVRGISHLNRAVFGGEGWFRAFCRSSVADCTERQNSDVSFF